MSIGHIDAGSSVTLGAAAGEIIALLLKNQENQTKAATLVAKAQWALAGQAAANTIQSGYDARDGYLMDMGTEIVSATAGAMSLAHTAYMTVQSSNLEATHKTQTANLDEHEKMLNTGSNDASIGNTRSPTVKADLEARMKNTQETIKTGKEFGNPFRDDLKPEHIAMLSKSERETLLTKIADKRTELDAELKKAQDTITRKISMFDNGTQVFSGFAKAGFIYGKGEAVVNQKMDEANAQLANQASSQMGQAFQELITSRNASANQIAQILQAKEAANNAVAYRG